MELPLFLSPIY